MKLITSMGTVLALALAMILLSTVARAEGDFARALAHTNPVPNYISVVKKHGAKLELTEEQTAELMAWNRDNRDRMRDLVMRVMELEAQLKQSSLEAKSAFELGELTREMLDTRLEIIQRKTRCRDHVRSVLSEQQWALLTTLVPA